MDRERILQILQQILDTAGLTELTRSKLEYMEQQIRAREPEPVLWARLLSELIEHLGSRMPSKIADFIKLYAENLHTAFGWSTFSICTRYYLIRSQGTDHTIAASSANLYEEQAEWCRILWNLHHLPNEVKEEKLSKAPAHEEVWLPPKPELQKDEILWTQEYHECCQNQKGKKSPPLVNREHFSVIPAKEGSHIRSLSGEIVVEHFCGILWAGLEIRTIGTGIDVLASGFDQAIMEPEHFRHKIDGGRHRFIFDQFPLSYSQAEFISIRAISNCFTVLDPPGEIPL